VAINFLAAGVTGYLFVKIYGTEGTPDDLPEIPDVHLPIGWIPFFGDALEQLNLLVWVALIFTAVATVYLFRTTIGLRHRSVGENPLASDTAGISVSLTRYLAVISSGMLAAMGGAFLSIGFVHTFNQMMTGGRGFIALAAVIFGRWHPVGALAAALLFGFSQALAQRLPAFSESTATLFQALPYLLTLIAVAGLVGRSRPPAADGIPYERH
jgi:general nucleoside transport system permease protein